MSRWITAQWNTNLNNILTTLKSANTDNPADYELMMWQLSLRDTMNNIKTFNPGNDVNLFITYLKKIYTKPELAIYPRIEEEFIRIFKNCSLKAFSNKW